MEEVPDDVCARLLKAIGAYLSDTPAQELPAELRRFRGFRPQGLQRHSKQLLSALDDEVLRAQIVEWLDERTVTLSKRDAHALRLAAERPEGWQEQLVASSRTAQEPARRSRSRLEIVEEQLARERERARESREEARRVKEETRLVRQSSRAAERELTRQVNDVTRRLERAEAETQTLRSEAEAAATRFERDLRRARRDAEKATDSHEELRSRLKRERRRVADLEARVAELEEGLAAQRRRTEGTSAQRRHPPARSRAPLTIPKGLLEDAPETLDEWLSEPHVHLLVDGYNVTKSEGGFGELQLVGQRDRLIEEVGRLARKKKAAATIVFDGSEVPPGTARAGRGPVKVVYSKPDESADDRLIALLSSLPVDPVVVATSDRELQDRARGVGANVATARQLLSLLRPRG